MNPVETHIGSNEGQGQFLPMLNGYVFPNEKHLKLSNAHLDHFGFYFVCFLI